MGTGRSSERDDAQCELSRDHEIVGEVLECQRNR